MMVGEQDRRALFSSQQMPSRSDCLRHVGLLSFLIGWEPTFNTWACGAILYPKSTSGNSEFTVMPRYFLLVSHFMGMVSRFWKENSKCGSQQTARRKCKTSDHIVTLMSVLLLLHSVDYIWSINNKAHRYSDAWEVHWQHGSLGYY